MFWRIPTQGDVPRLYIYYLQVFRGLRFFYMIKDTRQRKQKWWNRELRKQKVAIKFKLLHKNISASLGKKARKASLSSVPVMIMVSQKGPLEELSKCVDCKYYYFDWTRSGFITRKYFTFFHSYQL